VEIIFGYTTESIALDLGYNPTPNWKRAVCVEPSADLAGLKARRSDTVEPAYKDMLRTRDLIRIFETFIRKSYYTENLFLKDRSFLIKRR
jgi:hypothetical protein